MKKVWVLIFLLLMLPATIALADVCEESHASGETCADCGVYSIALSRRSYCNHNNSNYHRSEPFGQIQYTSLNSTNHRVTRHYRIYCRVCNTLIDDDYVGTSTEAHTFNSSGRCTGCGYSRGGSSPTTTTTTTYGFARNNNGYYESQNKGQHNTTATCEVTLQSNLGTAYIDVINYAETGWDYGTIYALDSRTNKLVTMSTSTYNKSTVQTFSVSLPDDRPHSLYITFRKDGSVNSYNDSMQFRIRFPSSTTSGKYGTAVISEGGYGFKLKTNGYCESQNKGQNSTIAACTVILQSTSNRAYIDVINYAESGFDYGTIYALDSRANTLATLNTSARNTSSVQTFEVQLPNSSPHTLYITFRKDSSVSSNNDSLQFRVRYGNASSSTTTTTTTTTATNPPAGSSFSVASSGTYGFTRNSNGYYESQNKGRASTTAACTVTLQSTAGRAFIDVINYAESGFDYGTIYALDSRTNTLVTMNSSTYNKSTVQTFEVTLPDSRQHTIYITFRKDSSVNSGNDSLQFRIRFPQGGTTTVASEDIYGFTLNLNGYYESQNKGQHSTTAACTVTVQSNTGRVYLDVINYAEASYDYGTIYNLDSRTSKKATLNTAATNKSTVQTFTFNVSDTREHTIYITFRKDFSNDRYNDSLQFRVRYE